MISIKDVSRETSLFFVCGLQFSQHGTVEHDIFVIFRICVEVLFEI